MQHILINEIKLKGEVDCPKHGKKHGVPMPRNKLCCDMCFQNKVSSKGLRAIKIDDTIKLYYPEK